MQLQGQQILSSQVTRDEETSCLEQYVKKQVWRQENMDCLQRQTFDEGILKELIDVICNECILFFVN